MEVICDWRNREARPCMAPRLWDSGTALCSVTCEDAALPVTDGLAAPGIQRMQRTCVTIGPFTWSDDVKSGRPVQQIHLALAPTFVFPTLNLNLTITLCPTPAHYLQKMIMKLLAAASRSEHSVIHQFLPHRSTSSTPPHTTPRRIPPSNASHNYSECSRSSSLFLPF